MKKLFMAVVCVSFIAGSVFTNNAFAQTAQGKTQTQTNTQLAAENARVPETSSEYKKNEFYLGYGLVSALMVTDMMLSGLGDAYTAPFTGLDGNIKDNGTWGPIYGGYNRCFFEHLSGGVNGSFQTIKSHLNYKDGNYINREHAYLTFMARIDFIYINSEWVRLYSGVSGGASFTDWSESGSSTWRYHDSGWIPAFHINLLGLRVGKDIGAFIEVGAGYLGLINFGISYEF